MQFNRLYDELELDLQRSDEEKLQVLAQWCEAHLSRDIGHKKTTKESFENYLEVTKSYFEEFLPFIPEDLSKGVAQFGGQSTIEAAAFLGFDRIISSLNPPQDLLNKPNANGMTPLHMAAVAGNFHTASVLLSLGSDVNRANKPGQLPIFSALVLPILHDASLKENKIKIFKLFQEKSAETLKHQDSSGDTVVHLMAINDYSSLLKDVLKTNNQLAFIKNNHTHYPIHAAILNNKLDCARILLEVKGVADLIDSQGRLALHYAARYSGEAMVLLCSNATKNINSPDWSGCTPLMLAARAGNKEAIRTLLDRGADVLLTDELGYTALHHAVLSSDLDTVRWLIDNTSTDLNARDIKNETLLMFCDTQEATEENEAIKHFLLERGAIGKE